MIRLAAALKGSISAVAVSALLLQGCAETAPTTPSGYTTVAGDPCQAERKTLSERNNYFAASVIAGAATGGAIGALATGSPIRALAAAAAGAAAGAVGGYYAYKKDNIASKSRLAEAIHEDIGRDIQEIDTTSANFLVLSQCRFNAARSIKAELQASRINREAAEAQLARQRTLFNEDVAFAETLGVKMNQRAAEFEFAANELIKDDAAAQQELAKRRAEEQARIDADEKAMLEADAKERAQAAAAVAPAAPAPAAQRAPASPRPVASAAAPAPAAAAAPAPAPRPAQASVQPTQRVRTLPVSATPMDVPGVSQLTDTNRIKRRAFNEQLTEAKATADNAFKIDAGISLAPVRIHAG